MPSDVETDYPLERPFARAVGVPHRFSVGVLMLLVTFFSVLFAALASYGAKPEVAAVVGVLFVGVAVGQSLLFGGKDPRLASFLVGLVLFPLEMLGVLFYRNAAGIGIEDSGGLVCGMVSGGPLGYAAGTVTAGIFLAMNWWNTRGRKPAALIELQPFAESDIDVLLGWVRSPALRLRWSRGLFREPLDRPQIERHLQPAAGPQPELLAFKAISPETGLPVGYVELRDIDRWRRSATIDLALIAPDEPERGELSIELLRAILEVAFGQMKLQRVQTIVPAYAREPQGCYGAMGFRSEGVLRNALRLGNRYEDVRIMSRLQSEWLWGVGTRHGRPPGAGE